MSVTALYFAGSLFFGCLTLIIGIVTGLWFAGSSRPTPSESTATDLSDGRHELALQRTRMLSSSVLRLAERVAGDVSAHSTKIEAVSADLRAIDPSLPEARQLVETAPERLLAANLQLQEQLTTAKQQIESQTVLLRARESEARTDLLTTLFNRRAFDEEIRKQLSVWDRKNIPFALLMLDIDRFKMFNDTHGHQVGDDVLREVAQVIVGQLRDMDTAFRYGGEEFAVILPTTKGSEAGIVAERIRKAIEQAVISSADKQLHVTTSVGVAPVIAADQTARMIGRADKALYKAKQSGRNCVRWHSGKEILSLGSSGKPAATEDAASGETQHSKPISLTAFNHELTRHVCDSRRFDNPLSLVCVRVGTRNTIDGVSETKAGERILPAIINLARRKLLKTDLVVPMGAAEFILVLPGRRYGVASQLMEDALDSEEARAVERLHSARIQYEACELLPHETAEQLLVRARENLLVTIAS